MKLIRELPYSMHFTKGQQSLVSTEEKKTLWLAIGFVPSTFWTRWWPFLQNGLCASDEWQKYKLYSSGSWCLELGICMRTIQKHPHMKLLAPASGSIHSCSFHWPYVLAQAVNMHVRGRRDIADMTPVFKICTNCYLLQVWSQESSIGRGNVQGECSPTDNSAMFCVHGQLRMTF